MRARIACLVMGLWTILAARAAAQLVPDQSFGPPTPHNLSSVLAEGFAYTAQTATAGVSGALVRADVYFGRHPGAGSTPWEIRVHEVIGGVPTGNLLAMETISATAVPTAGGTPVFTTVSFASPPTFTAGQQFALVVHLQGTSGAPGLFAGNWYGNSDGLYPGGRSFHSGNGVNWGASGPDFDLFFRTYVRIPEPGTSLTLTVCGLVFLRRRRARC